MEEIKFRAWEKEKMRVRKGSKGMYKQNGYVLAKAPYHPYANKRGVCSSSQIIDGKPTWEVLNSKKRTCSSH